MSSTDLDQDVRSKLFQLMTGLLPLRDFQVWFAPVAWRLGRPENKDRFPLTRRVELRLAEYTNGDWSEPQLLAELGRLVRSDPTRAPTTPATGFGVLTNRPYRVIEGWYSAERTEARRA